MYNYSGYFIFLFVFIKVIFKKPEQVKSIILIQFSMFVLLQFYSFPSSSEYKRAIISSECLCLLFIRVITL